MFLNVYNYVEDNGVDISTARDLRFVATFSEYISNHSLKYG